MGFKKCSKCGQTKNVELFPLRGDGKGIDIYKSCCKDCFRIYQAEYRQRSEYKDRRPHYEHKYVETHKEKHCIRVRVAKEARRKGDLTEKQWNEVLEAHDHHCVKCGTKEQITMDHIKPLSIGGEHTKDNVQPLCRKCNSVKGLKTIDYRALAIYSEVT